MARRVQTMPEARVQPIAVRHIAPQAYKKINEQQKGIVEIFHEFKPIIG